MCTWACPMRKMASVKKGPYCQIALGTDSTLPCESEDLLLTLHYFNCLGTVQSDSLYSDIKWGLTCLLPAGSLLFQLFVKGSEVFENEQIITILAPLVSHIK